MSEEGRKGGFDVHNAPQEPGERTQCPWDLGYGEVALPTPVLCSRRVKTFQIWFILCSAALQKPGPVPRSQWQFADALLKQSPEPSVPLSGQEQPGIYAGG